jgi:mannose-6-phosphate isomerase
VSKREPYPFPETGAPRPNGRTITTGPWKLPSNRLNRFYAGGARIDGLGDSRAGLAEPAASGATAAGLSNGGGPEEWIGSTTLAFGAQTEGLSRLPDGRFLRDAIQADPATFLGAAHMRRWGETSALLVKLLDAGERLPVHCHPGRRFAAGTLGLSFGKTEAWIIVAADSGAAVHLGLREEVKPSTALGWIQDQKVPEMLGAMHEVPVRKGQVLFVPAGTLHAIGEGILMVELQEPTDLSVLLEWRRFGVDEASAHLELGWARALHALDLGRARTDKLVVRDGLEAALEPVVDLLPERARPYFRAQWITLGQDAVSSEPSFAVLVVLTGSLAVSTDHGETLELSGGDTALVPYGAGCTKLEGSGEVIRCLPPASDAGVGQW